MDPHELVPVSPVLLVAEAQDVEQFMLDGTLSTVQNSTVQYSTVQCSTVQCSTVQYSSTVQ